MEVIKMQHLTLREKYLKLTGYGQTGGKYCNAIDEDIYDSSDWSNYMPASGYSFKTLKGGKVRTIYEHYFPCFDGYDSSCYEPEYFNSLEIAINSLWLRESLDNIYDCFQALVKADKVNLNNNYLNVYQADKGYSYNVKDIMSRLYNDIYPSLRGKE